MRRRSAAGGTVVELSRARFRESDQLAHRFHRQRGMHDQNIRQRCPEGDRDEIAQRVIRRLRVKDFVDHYRACCHQQRRAVRRRACHGFDADNLAGARPVFDNELLALAFRQFLRQHAREYVGAAARRRRHDDAHRFRRVGSALRNRGGDDERKREQHQYSYRHRLSSSSHSNPDRALFRIFAAWCTIRCTPGGNVLRGEQ